MVAVEIVEGSPPIIQTYCIPNWTCTPLAGKQLVNPSKIVMGVTCEPSVSY